MTAAHVRYTALTPSAWHPAARMGRNVRGSLGGTSRAPQASSAASVRPFAAENWSDEGHDHQSLRTESGREPVVRQPARRLFVAIRTTSAKTSSTDASPLRRLLI